MMHNFDGTYQGRVPISQAVAQSLIYQLCGYFLRDQSSKGFDKTKEFGLPLADSDKKYYGLALGGVEKWVLSYDYGGGL